MSAKPLSRARVEAAIKSLELAGGIQVRAAEMAGCSVPTLRYRLEAGKRLYGLTPNLAAPHIKDPTAEAGRMIDQLQETIRLLKKDNERLEENRLNEDKVRRMIHECDQIPKPPKWFVQSRPRKTTGIPTLFLSDWHWDEVVDPRQINGVNAYNPAIQERRLKTAFTMCVELTMQHLAKPNFEYIVVPLGGDMLSGNIHEELRESNSRPIALSVANMRDHLVAGISMLADTYGKVYLPCVTGNHGRIDKKPRAKNRAYDSYEWFLYEFLRTYFLKDDRVHFDIADGPDIYWTACGMTYLMTHGDQAKGGSGISAALSPLMLLDSRKRKRALATKQYFDYLIMGHWHQLIELKSFLVNGSGKGYDEWTASMNFDFEIPQQALWLTHPDHGITVRWPVQLEPKGTRF